MPAATFCRSNEGMSPLSTSGASHLMASDDSVSASDDLSDAINPSVASGLAEESDSPQCPVDSESAQFNPLKALQGVRFRKMKPPRRQFQTLQTWEGIVIEICSDESEGTFFAELHDLTNEANPVEFADLLVSDVPKPDRGLLNPGAVFYWIVGYETTEFGQIRKVSEFRFRRAPKWTDAALKRIKRRATLTFGECQGDDTCRTAER